MTDFERARDQFLAVARREQDKIAAVIRGLERLTPIEAPGLRSPQIKKLSGDRAEEVLVKHGNTPLHYREIAREMIDAGYSGVVRVDEPPGSQSHIDRIAHSLSGTLARERDRFEATGGGRYRLRYYQGP